MAVWQGAAVLLMLAVTCGTINLRTRNVTSPEYDPHQTMAMASAQDGGKSIIAGQDCATRNHRPLTSFALDVHSVHGRMLGSGRSSRGLGLIELFQHSQNDIPVSLRGVRQTSCSL